MSHSILDLMIKVVAVITVLFCREAVESCESLLYDQEPEIPLFYRDSISEDQIKVVEYLAHLNMREKEASIPEPQNYLDVAVDHFRSALAEVVPPVDSRRYLPLLLFAQIPPF